MTPSGQVSSLPRTLGELAEAARARGLAVELRGNPDVALTGMTEDSRRVRPGDLFVAKAGTRADGTTFLEQAALAGAAAWLGRAGTAGPQGLPALLVEDVAQAAGLVASLFHGEPSRRLDLVGVTGTNGKTSTTWLLEQVWRTAGLPCGIAGTIRQSGPGFEEEASMTTLPAIELQALLARMVGAGAKAAAIEVSSHALAQARVAGCRFRAAIFTNLTRDHLDYHGDEDSYFEAKALLFRRYLDPALGVAVLNADDARVVSLAAELAGADVWTWSTEPGATTRARVLAAELDLEGIRARIGLDGRALEISSPLVGLPNLSNMLAAAAAAFALGVDPAAIAEGLSAAAPVPGRLERVGERLPVVLVDYAHTPDALERTLAAVRSETRGRLICVFGCGGDRDRGKRPLMGKIAAQGADLSIVTSDNPRSEDPHAILEEIVAGMTEFARLLDESGEPRAAGARGILVEVDREIAIREAVACAAPEDVVVIAGKGHETYQDAGGERRDFDDRLVAREALARRGDSVH